MSSFVSRSARTPGRLHPVRHVSCPTCFGMAPLLPARDVLTCEATKHTAKWRRPKATTAWVNLSLTPPPSPPRLTIRGRLPFEFTCPPFPRGSCEAVGHYRVVNAPLLGPGGASSDHVAHDVRLPTPTTCVRCGFGAKGKRPSGGRGPKQRHAKHVRRRRRRKDDADRRWEEEWPWHHGMDVQEHEAKREGALRVACDARRKPRKETRVDVERRGADV